MTSKSSLISLPPFPCLPSRLPLVAGWADDPHHLRRVAADVHQPVWCRRAVVDGIAGRELEDVRAELERDDALEHDEELLGVAVGVRVIARGAAGVELADDDLQVLERSGREHELPPERPEREVRPRLASEHPRLPCRSVRLEEVGDVDAERRRDPLQRRDARVRTTALDLAQEALREVGAVRDGLQGRPPETADRPEAFPDVDTLEFSDLRVHRRKLKRHYSSL